MGPVEENIIQQAKRERRPIPDRIVNKPKLKRGLELYLNAYYELDNERSHALALTPIPGSCIRSYADYYHFDAEQKDDLIYLVREMDNANLKRLSK